MAVATIVALCGVKRSGKDTVAKYLVDNHGFSQVEIARPLKDALRLIFDLDETQVDGARKEEPMPRLGLAHDGRPVTPRTLMQVFGTELMQLRLQEMVPAVERNVWIDKATRSIQGYLHQGRSVVVSDLRFLHEAEALTAAFGDATLRIVCVRRADAERVPDTHASETEWKRIAHAGAIDNDATYECLYRRVEECLTRMQSRERPGPCSSTL